MLTSVIMTSWEKKHVRQKRSRKRSRLPALRISVGNISMTDVITTSMATNCAERRRDRISTFSKCKHVLLKRVHVQSYLCVQTQEDEHDKETDGPQLGQRHHGNSLRIRNERQAWTWKTTTSPSTICLRRLANLAPMTLNKISPAK